MWGLGRKQNYSGRWEVLIKKATDILNKMFLLASKSSCPRNYILDQVRPAHMTDCHILGFLSTGINVLYIFMV